MIASINERKIRIALVGCGRISHNHIKAIILHHERAELVALCDIEQERLDSARHVLHEVSQEHSATVRNPAEFIGYEKLIEAVNLDIIEADLVVLTTPSGLHPSQAIAAAEGGRRSGRRSPRR